MTLFEQRESASDHEPDAPLATRMRPRTFQEFVGQEAIVGPGRVLRRSIEADRLSSIIFWGPPGSGKTTLAEIVARLTRSHFIALSAVSAGVADLRKAAEEARRRKRTGQRTILFVDEIHRFNRAQQDAVLPFVESGLLVLIGATTENPSFSVNAALLSRCRVFRLEALSDEQVVTIVHRTLDDRERGLGALGVQLEAAALNHLVAMANGDARVALNALELAVAGTSADPTPAAAEGRPIDLAAIEQALQRRALLYDKTGDQHYDLISAYIKSVRGSDPDAAVYWLARMLEAGEDPLFVARRIVILASEDVGLADPQALVIAVAAQQAAHFIGLPEAVFALTEATLYLATAPKSNSAKVAYFGAVADVQRTGNEPVPLHLRNAPTGLMRAMGYGQGYKYAHDYTGGYVEQQHLPDTLKDQRYYRPTEHGAEAAMKQKLDRLR